MTASSAAESAPGGERGQRTRPAAHTASTTQMHKTQKGRDVITHHHRCPLNRQKIDKDNTAAE